MGKSGIYFYTEIQLFKSKILVLIILAGSGGSFDNS